MSVLRFSGLTLLALLATSPVPAQTAPTVQKSEVDAAEARRALHAAAKSVFTAQMSEMTALLTEHIRLKCMAEQEADAHLCAKLQFTLKAVYLSTATTPPTRAVLVLGTPLGDAAYVLAYTEEAGWQPLPDEFR